MSLLCVDEYFLIVLQLKFELEWICKFLFIYFIKPQRRKAKWWRKGKPRVKCDEQVGDRVWETTQSAR